MSSKKDRNYKIAVIGGDGTGPEVTAEALKVLNASSKKNGFKLALTHFDFGGERYLKTKKVLSDKEVAGLKKFDAILLGAVGHPDEGRSASDETLQHVQFRVRVIDDGGAHQHLRRTNPHHIARLFMPGRAHSFARLRIGHGRDLRLAVAGADVSAGFLHFEVDRGTADADRRSRGTQRLRFPRREHRQNRAGDHTQAGQCQRPEHALHLDA